MIAGSIARRYARALLGIGVKQGIFDPVGQELDVLAGAFSASKDLRQALTSPVFPLAARRQVLDAVLDRAGASKTVRSFCLLLLERDRIGSLPDVAREYRALADEHAGRVRAHVTAAKPLPPAEIDRLRAELEKSTGKKVILTAGVDPGVIGGLVTKIGDIVYDGSIRTTLATLRAQLLPENGQG